MSESLTEVVGQAVKSPPSVQMQPAHNHLLAALPPGDFARLAPFLDSMVFKLGAMLYEPGSQMTHAYFPCTAVVSLHYMMASGACAESAGVGQEGMVGTSLFMGGDSTSSSALVQTAGLGYRLERGRLKTEFNRCEALHSILLRYTQGLMCQMMQTAACNRHHSTVQQLSRWLLLNLDRNPSGAIVVTQELVARMLGVRRESITEAAGQLQLSGWIRYRRGHIQVLSRPGLESQVCECYAVVKRERERLMSSLP